MIAEGQFPGDMQRDNTKDDDGAVPVLTREERQSSESWDEPRHLVTRDNHVDRQGFRKLPANRFGGDKRWELSEGKENPEVCNLKQDMLNLILLLCFMWQPFILKSHPGVC